MDLMDQLNRRRDVTVVMVSRELNPAVMYADPLPLLSKGRIAGRGLPKEVMDFALLEQVYVCFYQVRSFSSASPASGAILIKSESVSQI